MFNKKTLAVKCILTKKINVNYTLLQGGREGQKIGQNKLCNLRPFPNINPSNINIIVVLLNYPKNY